MSAIGLTRVRSEDLKRLLHALHRGHLPSPVTRSALIVAAFGHIESQLEPIVGRDTVSAQVLIACVLAERTERATSNIALSFCAAELPGTHSRDLFEQVRDLLGGATRRITLLGLSPDDDVGLFKALRALLQGRDLSLDLWFAADSPAAVAELLGEHFPERDRVQAFVCKDRKLRARVVIADDVRVLVTSGALTTREQDGHIDVGVYFSDANYVAALRKEWQELERAGFVERI